MFPTDDALLDAVRLAVDMLEQSDVRPPNLVDRLLGALSSMIPERPRRRTYKRDDSMFLYGLIKDDLPREVRLWRIHAMDDGGPADPRFHAEAMRAIFRVLSEWHRYKLAGALAARQADLDEVVRLRIKNDAAWSLEFDKLMRKIGRASLQR